MWQKVLKNSSTALPFRSSTGSGNTKPFGPARRTTHLFPSLLLFVFAAANAQSYSAYNLGALSSGALAAGGGSGVPGEPSGAYGLNDLGQVVGSINGKAFYTGANGKDMVVLDVPPFAGGPGNALANGESGLGSVAVGINNQGQVVGNVYYQFGGGCCVVPMTQSFITGTNGIGLSAVQGIGGYTAATAVNNTGQITGVSGGYTGFVSGPQATGLTPFLNSNLAVSATAINDVGQVAGTYYVPAPPGSQYLSLGMHAYVTGANGQGFHDLGSLNNNNLGSSATAINSQGIVVGDAGVWNGATNASRAFMSTQSGNLVDIGTLGDSLSYAYAYGINTAGQIVGASSTAGNAQLHAFVTGANGAGMVDLNSLVTLADHSYLVGAVAINNNGQILANGADGNAYLLTQVSSVPEPASIEMTIVGLGLVGIWHRRRKAWPFTTLTA